MASKTRLYIREKGLLANFWGKPLKLLQSENILLNKSSQLELYVVAFNNSDLIKTQHQTLQMYLKDNFHYTVVDNSSDLYKRNAIFEYCKQEKIPYIGLPKNPYSGISASKSHGLALNWIYERLVKKCKPQYFGFLDHDIFLRENCSVVSKLKNQPIYGHKQERGSMWYLWPGYSFFELRNTHSHKIDFMPINGADTGSGNFLTYFSTLDLPSIKFAQHEYREIPQKNRKAKEKIEVLDEWVHIIGASNWSMSKTIKDHKSVVNV